MERGFGFEFQESMLVGSGVKEHPQQPKNIFITEKAVFPFLVHDDGYPRTIFMEQFK